LLALTADARGREALGKFGLAAILDNRGAVARTLILIVARARI